MSRPSPRGDRDKARRRLCNAVIAWAQVYNDPIGDKEQLDVLRQRVDRYGLWYARMCGGAPESASNALVDEEE